MSASFPARLLQTQSDERLLAAASEGHERAFEALVLRYRRPLLRYCRRLLLPEARAEDALQQGLLHAWLALQRGTQVHDARAWLYRVVHNAAIDALRKSGYDHEQLSESLEGGRAPEADLERRTAVRQALAGFAGLPELQREALLRTAIEGHSHEEVAAALGLSHSAIRGLVYRARTTLRTVATAITPPPLVAWLANAGARGAPLAQRLGEVGAGGGAAGATGVLLKGGAALLTAGALVAGVVTVHHQTPNAHGHGKPTLGLSGTGADETTDVSPRRVAPTAGGVASAGTGRSTPAGAQAGLAHGGAAEAWGGAPSQPAGGGRPARERPAAVNGGGSVGGGAESSGEPASSGTGVVRDAAKGPGTPEEGGGGGQLGSGSAGSETPAANGPVSSSGDDPPAGASGPDDSGEADDSGSGATGSTGATGHSGEIDSGGPTTSGSDAERPGGVGATGTSGTPAGDH